MPGKKFLVVATILILLTPACSPSTTQAEPAQVIEATASQPSAGLPLTEADVPRVTVEQAKAALDSGAAVIVDVRSAEAFASSHVAGAINILLGEIETNPAGLNLDKDQWLITYCT